MYSPIFAQQEEIESLPNYGRTSFFLELGGNAGAYSLNVDHLLNDEISLRGGITVLPGYINPFTGEEIPTRVGVPVMVNFLVGKERHVLEVGFGALVSRVITPTMTIGYRWQPPYEGFLFRIGFTPFFNFSEEKFFQPSGGISLGYSFN
jgi:hypothetical protein